MIIIMIIINDNNNDNNNNDNNNNNDGSTNKGGGGKIFLSRVQHLFWTVTKNIHLFNFLKPYFNHIYSGSL